MSKVSQLEPKSVFHFFEEICEIPHGSGNVERISNYLVDFAKERNLAYFQDELKNVVIIKEATAGYDKEEPVILQGHMDMVAVKKPDCAKDMTKEGLDLDVDGDYLLARGTSLGGDDGIAVAYGLALLDSESIAHPRLEVVITVDEETGMEGANGIDLSMCRGRRMLNLDNEEEGVLLTSCAGGARVHGRLPVETEEKQGCRLLIEIGGLTGGHSGAEIDKGRANAICLLGRLMHFCRKKGDVRFMSVEGGSADNAIPSASRAELFAEQDNCADLEDSLGQLEKILQREYTVTDSGIRIRILEKGQGEWEVFTEESTKKAEMLLFMMPNGIQSMSADISGLVQTSLNLGILRTEGREVELDYSVRSSVMSEKEMIIDKVCLLLESQGGKWDISGDYPAWEFKQNSPLREKMVKVYEEMYGKSPRIEAIHAGLECGILAGKLPGLDCVSIGPDMKDIHTPEERLSISSTKRVWDYVLEILKKKEN